MVSGRLGVGQTPNLLLTHLSTDAAAGDSELVSSQVGLGVTATPNLSEYLSTKGFQSIGLGG